MYDNEKLDKALDQWLRECCEVGFGQVYSRALLMSFEVFVAREKLLQASPGMTAFGAALTRRGFGRKRVNGLQWRTGLVLKTPPAPVEEARHSPDPEKVKAVEKQIRSRKTEVKKKVQTAAEKAKDKDEVRRRMREESKDRNIAAGGDG